MTRVAAIFLFLTSPLLAQAVSVPSPETIVGAPRGERLSGVALEEKTKEVASLLRCPVCQGLSIFDSPSPMAVNMKNQVRDLLAAGYDRNQVLAYFEASYGEFVRLQPALRGMNWLVWLAPLLLALGGAWAVRARMKRGRASEQAIPATDPSLEPYLERVRAMVRGGDGAAAVIPSESEGSGRSGRA